MPQLKKPKTIKSKVRVSGIRGLTMALAFAAAGGLVVWASLAAGSLTLYLSPASKTVNKGGSFSVQVRISNSGTGKFSQVEANLTFPASKLSVNSVTLDTSNFSFGQESFDNSAGTISISNDRIYYQPLAQGDFLVATISFKAIASGAATVGFSGSSQASGGFRSPTNLLTGTTGGTYTVSVPTPPPSPKPKPTPTPKPKPQPPASSGSGSSAKSGGTSSAVKTPSKPKAAVSGKCSAGGAAAVDNIQVAKLGYRSVQVDWNVSAGYGSTFVYGTSPTNPINSFKQGCSAAAHSVSITQLQPATTYYYKITADGSSPAAEAADSFTTTGWPVVLSLQTTDGRPLASANVAVGSQTGKTDDKGRVSFNLAPGAQALKVNGSTYDFTVKALVLKTPAEKPPAQDFNFKVTPPGKSAAELAGGAVVATAALAWFLAAAVRRRGGGPRPKPVPSSPKMPDDMPKAGPDASLPPVPEPMYVPPPPVQGPAPHATRYPWVIGQPEVKKRRSVGSSIAADGDYVEPEDMFSEGKKRLKAEGLAPRDDRR